MTRSCLCLSLFVSLSSEFGGRCSLCITVHNASIVRSAQEYYYPWSNGVNTPENRTMKRSPQSFVPKRKHRGQADAKDLEGKVKQAGLLGGLSGLERHIPAPADSPWVETNDEVASGLYGSRVSRGTSTLHRARLFRTPGGASRVSSRTRNHDDQSKTINSEPSKRSRFTRASTRRAYGNVPAVHVVCAISENMARETCVASLDAGKCVRKEYQFGSFVVFRLL